MMKLALAMIAVLAVTFVTNIILANMNGWLGGSFFILSGITSGIVGKVIGKLEKRVKSLPCATPDLESRYQAINRSWKRKAWPDF